MSLVKDYTPFRERIERQVSRDFGDDIIPGTPKAEAADQLRRYMISNTSDALLELGGGVGKKIKYEDVYPEGTLAQQPIESNPNEPSAEISFKGKKVETENVQQALGQDYQESQKQNNPNNHPTEGQGIVGEQESIPKVFEFDFHGKKIVVENGEMAKQMKPVEETPYARQIKAEEARTISSTTTNANGEKITENTTIIGDKGTKVTKTSDNQGRVTRILTEEVNENGEYAGSLRDEKYYYGEDGSVEKNTEWAEGSEWLSKTETEEKTHTGSIKTETGDELGPGLYKTTTVNGNAQGQVTTTEIRDGNNVLVEKEVVSEGAQGKIVSKTSKTEDGTITETYRIGTDGKKTPMLVTKEDDYGEKKYTATYRIGTDGERIPMSQTREWKENGDTITERYTENGEVVERTRKYRNGDVERSVSKNGETITTITRKDGSVTRKVDRTTDIEPYSTTESYSTQEIPTPVEDHYPDDQPFAEVREPIYGEYKLGYGAAAPGLDFEEFYNSVEPEDMSEIMRTLWTSKASEILGAGNAIIRIFESFMSSYEDVGGDLGKVLLDNYDLALSNIDSLKEYINDNLIPVSQNIEQLKVHLTEVDNLKTLIDDKIQEITNKAAERNIAQSKLDSIKSNPRYITHTTYYNAQGDETSSKVEGGTSNSYKVIDPEWESEVEAAAAELSRIQDELDRLERELNTLNQKMAVAQDKAMACISTIQGFDQNVVSYKG